MENVDLTTLDWLGAIGWTIVGILFYKAWIFPHGATKFNIWRWLDENWIDFLRGLLLTLIVVKLGDIVFQLISLTGVDLNQVSAQLKEIGLDPIQTALVISIGAQHLLYKRKKKKE